jgi:hypothetical protein
MNQSKTIVFILEIDLISSRFSRSLLQISDDKTLTEARLIGASTQDPYGKIIAPCTFDVKFPYITQFTFKPLMFAMGEDKNIKMLPSGSAPERLTLVYGQALCFSAISSTTEGACSGLDPYAWLHIRTVKLVRGIPIVTSIL